MSSRSRHSKESKIKSIKLVLISLVIFAIGYYLLNHIATLEDPPIGPLFHIILGCILMALSTLFVLLIVKKTFFSKKKRSKSRQVFLKDQQRNSEAN